MNHLSQNYTMNLLRNQNNKKGDMMLTPWEVITVREFLKDKKDYIMQNIKSDLGTQIGNLIFAVLDRELDYELEEGGKQVEKDLINNS